MSRASKMLRRLILCALLTAIAMILSFLEGLFPFPMPVPGLKLGLANVVTMFALYHLTLYEAATVVTARCILSSLLFGGVASLPFSLAGGLLALLAMAAARRIRRFSFYGVGIAGAAAHNAGQISVAAAAYASSAMFAYLVPLLPASIVTGAAVALIYRFFAHAVKPALRSMGIGPINRL